jgi:hypothetical protein
LSFVGADAARANEQLYIDEMLDEWVAEWMKAAAVEAANQPQTARPDLAVTDSEDIPF